MPKTSKKKAAPKIRLTMQEKKFVAHKVKLLMDEGKTQNQALGEAHGMVRQKRKKR